MGSMINHVEWFNKVSQNASGREAALKADITVSTLNRQLSVNHLSAEYVIALARAYDEPPVKALAATGYLLPTEVSDISMEEMSDLLTDQQLIRLLAMRIDDDPSAWFGTFGELAEEGADVFELSQYAADDRVPEPEEGDDDYGPGA